MSAILCHRVSSHLSMGVWRPRRPRRDGPELRETVWELRRRFARGEIDAAGYERRVALLGFDHLDF
jgi:hypothetical protein